MLDNNLRWILIGRIRSVPQFFPGGQPPAIMAKKLTMSPSFSNEEPTPYYDYWLMKRIHYINGP